jgi:hypothetical protein
MISVAGSVPKTRHTTVIPTCPSQDIKQLQRFLSMVNFYRHLLPGCAPVLQTLTDLLKGRTKTLEWTYTAEEAFQNAKQLLSAAIPQKNNILPSMLSFPWLLTPPNSMWEASCNKNQEIIGVFLVFSPKN